MTIDTENTSWRALHSAAAATLLPDAGGPASTSRPGAATGTRSGDPVVEYLTYGPPLPSGRIIEIPATYGSMELEYAAIRSGAGIMHRPERATVRVTGGDRIEFLNRMLTQELADLTPGEARRAFWLNRKGRIEADLLVLQQDDAALIDVDRHDCARLIETLSEFIFADDIAFEDVTGEVERFTLLGPDSVGIAVSEPIAAARETPGVPGAAEVFVPGDLAPNWWQDALRAARPVGWFAYNIVRIESGVPQMHIDFDSEHLPHETGILAERVSFTKGCYLGQEIVARMESRGRPKQIVVGLRIKGDALPIEGTQIFAGGDEAPETPIGAVTSSTLSPMLGAQPIALAMVRHAHARIGTALRLHVDGALVDASVVERPFVQTQGAAT